MTPEVSSPAYYRRYLADVDEADGEEQLLRYMETLNQPDWIDFLSDVAAGHARAIGVIQPRSGDELVGQMSALLERTSPASQRIAARALEQLIDGQVSGGRECFSPDEAHSLFSLAALLTTGIEVQRFATIANHPGFNLIYRDEAGRVIANHGADAPIELWRRLDLSLTPTLAPVALLGLAAHDIREAAEHLAKACRDCHESPAMKLALRDVLQKCLREQGVPGVGQVVDVLCENETLKGMVHEFLDDYPDFPVPFELPSWTVRNSLRKFSDRVQPRDADVFEAKLRKLLCWVDEGFTLAESGNEEYNREHVVNQVNSVLQLLHIHVYGDGKTEFLIAVCQDLLKQGALVLPDTVVADFARISSERNWDQQQFRTLFERRSPADL